MKAPLVAVSVPVDRFVDNHAISMRYVSTRGEAPSLDFVEVMLAGLARDGGLYVPESWPSFDAKTIAQFAGRPYAEVALEVMRPFVAGTIGDADLARMTREAYDGFRHPATAPLVQIRRRPSCSSCFTARRWRSRIWRCSCWRG